MRATSRQANLPEHWQLKKISFQMESQKETEVSHAFMFRHQQNNHIDMCVHCTDETGFASWQQTKFVQTKLVWSDGFPTSLTPTQISQLLLMIKKSSVCHMKIEGKELNALNKCSIAQSARKIRKGHLKTIDDSEYLFLFCTDKNLYTASYGRNLLW